MKGSINLFHGLPFHVLGACKKNTLYENAKHPEEKQWLVAVREKAE